MTFSVSCAGWLAREERSSHRTPALPVPTGSGQARRWPNELPSVHVRDDRTPSRARAGHGGQGCRSAARRRPGEATSCSPAPGVRRALLLDVVHRVVDLPSGLLGGALTDQLVLTRGLVDL